MFLKSWQWKKMLLSGGLLFVLAQGTLLLPEVRQGIWPEALVQEKLLQYKIECENVSKGLNFAFNTLALQEAIYGEPPREKDLFLVRKALVSAAGKLNYLDPALKRLQESCKPGGGQGDEMNSVQKGVQFLYWRCQQQRIILQDLMFKVFKVNYIQGILQKTLSTEAIEKREADSKNDSSIF